MFFGGVITEVLCHSSAFFAAVKKQVTSGSRIQKVMKMRLKYFRKLSPHCLKWYQKLTFCTWGWA